MKTNTRIALVVLVIIVAAIVVAIVRSKPSSTSYTAPTPTTTTPVQPVGEPSNTVSYSCDAGQTITAVYYQGQSTPSSSPDQPPVPGGSVVLTLSDGRTMTLAQTISADGTRYASADGAFVFWSKGNGATVLENNQPDSFTGCILEAPQPVGANLPAVYSNSKDGFSMRLPSLAAAGTTATADQYAVDASYAYQALGPGKNINGVKFTIPKSLAAGTNLSPDSYISVEEIPKATTCSASLFASPGAKVSTVTDNGTTYSMAMTSDAGAGNRYDETVYAIPGTSPCVAVRYYIHYSAFDNYPAGSITQFDEQALVSDFDQIRRTLVLNQ
jgi:membrane-bound inhibitor of C-type lysozyme